VGIIHDAKHITTQSFKNEGDAILLIGDLGEEIGGSQFFKIVHGKKIGQPPRLDFQRELAVHETLRSLIRSGFIKSAHDCSECGLAVALVECCISGEKSLGAQIDLGETGLRLDQLLFNESQSRIIISVSKTNAAAALALIEW